jgi:hypothetical protein
VNGLTGNNRNDCQTRQHACKTIAHAISLSSPGNSIVVSAAAYAENLVIPHSLQIIGAGAAATIIDGRGVASPIINSNPRAAVTARGITLTGGGGPGDGGGLYNCMSTMMLIDVTISGNTASRGMGNLGYGGGIYNCPGSSLTIINSALTGNAAEAGGAICNGGFLTIANSTLSGNVARGHRGGGIFNYGSLTIRNSLIKDNKAPGGAGGGINNGQLFKATGTATIDGSTISHNTAAEGGGIFNLPGTGLTIQNSTLSGNSGGNISLSGHIERLRLGQ